MIRPEDRYEGERREYEFRRGEDHREHEIESRRAAVLGGAAPPARLVHDKGEHDDD